MIVLDLDELFADHQPHTPLEIQNIATVNGMTFLQALAFLNAESLDSPYARIAGDGCWHYVSKFSPIYRDTIRERARRYTHGDEE
jgi:hypothetical protein